MFQREKDFLGHNYFLINLIKQHIRKDFSKHQKIRHVNIGRSIYNVNSTHLYSCNVLSLSIVYTSDSEFVSSLVMIRIPCSSQQKLRLEEPLK